MKQASQISALRYPTQGIVLLGKYRVEDLIGEGGMGAVVRAMHLDLEEPVAIKVLLPELAEREDVVRRFLREAKSAVKLKGEHIARVMDVGYLDGFFEGRPYIVMEYLQGADLRAIIKHHGPQHPAIAVDLMLQACEAIAEAHSLGIIHRDIKPSNFFITRPDGYEPCLKVLDFGIATPPIGTTDVTNTDSVVGTPSYMAPEQMRNAREANAQSDVWSLGVVLYECLEGRRPFAQSIYSELCFAVATERPQPMVRTPQPIARVVLKCLEKALEYRYQNVAELAFDLAPFSANVVSGQASAEVCARMLRRRSQMHPIADRDGDSASGTPPPLTPRSRLPMPSQQISSVTPSREVRAPARWPVVLASFIVACALIAGGWWYATQRGESGRVEEQRITLPSKASQPTPAPAASPATSPAPAPSSESTASSKSAAAEPSAATSKSAPASAAKPASVVATKPASVATKPLPTAPTHAATPVKRPAPAKRHIERPAPPPASDDDAFSHR